LNNIQPERRAREILFSRDCDEVFELPQIHGGCTNSADLVLGLSKI
jgi:hypothetical protein